MLDSSAEAVSRYSMRATLWRKLSKRDGLSRSFKSRSRRRRSSPVFDRYGAPSLGHRTKTAGSLGTASSAASRRVRSSAISIAVMEAMPDLPNRDRRKRLFLDRFGIDQLSNFCYEFFQMFGDLIAV